MKPLKKKIMVVCSLMMAAALLVGGTLAYFFDEKTVTNEFTTAGDTDENGVSIKLEEPSWDESKGEDLLPGDVVPKDPTVTNLQGEVYVRFIVELTDGNGDRITDEEVADKILSMLVYDPDSTISENSAYSSTALSSYYNVNPSFTLDTSRSTTGLYYYNYDGTMDKDDTLTLFHYVIVPTDWTQDDLDLIGDDFNIVIKAQAIQTANIADADTAFSALDDEIANAVSSS